MTDIFISYSREDAEFARRIYEELRHFDVRGFMDAADIAAGAEISNKLRDSIRNADAVVVILSEASRNSNWVMFELGLAESMNKLVVPVIAPGSVYERAVPEQIIDRLAITADANSTQEVAAKIVSAATGTSVAESLERVASEERKRRRLVSVVAGALAALAAAALLLAFQSFTLRQAAEEAREFAEASALESMELRVRAEEAADQARRALEEVTALTAGASSIAVSPDGQYLAVSSERGGFELLVRTGFDNLEPLARREFDDRVSSLAFSPDGRLLAAATWNSRIFIFRIDDMRTLLEIAGDEPIADVVFSPDGQTLLSRSLDGRLDIWSAESGELISSRRVE